MRKTSKVEEDSGGEQMNTMAAGFMEEGNVPEKDRQ